MARTSARLDSIAAREKTRSGEYGTRIMKVAKTSKRSKGKGTRGVATPTGRKRGRPKKGSYTAAKTTKASSEAIVDSDRPKGEEIFDKKLGNTIREWEVEKLLDSKNIKGTRHYLVKWMGYPENDCTWEPEENLCNSQAAITAFNVEFPNKP